MSETPSNSKASGFVHLHVHTHYSLVDSTVRIKPLIKATAEQAMPAVAICDVNNFFAMVKMYGAARSAGIQPIFGMEIAVRVDGERYHLLLLCQNDEGYLNLTRLITKGYLEGQDHEGVTVEERWLFEFSAGLIALSGGWNGILGPRCFGDASQAHEVASRFADIYPNAFYLEVQRLSRNGEAEWLDQTIQLADELGLPIVATNDVRFLQRSDFEAHEVRVCIRDGYTLNDESRPKRYTDQQYLKSPEEMQALFADLPDAIENSLEIARRCSLELTLGKAVLPDFEVPEGSSVGQWLRQVSREGLEQRFENLRKTPAGLADEEQAYRDRLEMELDVIEGMGFPGYFLIVADFIRWARNNGVPVGPGRGSGAGSLVAYVLEITDLDPLAYDLLFERFLNPERVSMPDFDIDFCMDGRDRVIEYVADHYGHEKVSQIITFGSMAAKAVIRDVGRVLGHPYGFVDRIAKTVPGTPGMTLEGAMEESEDFANAYRDEEEVTYLVDLAKALEGLARQVGKHAGGVVIAPTALTDFTPLYCEAGGDNRVTQFDKDDVEAAGLVKFDFLGLRTLTIVDRALKIINAEKERLGEAPLDISTIPLDDPATFGLLKRGETSAVFQLESPGMKKLIRKLLPDCFEDIVALVALFRPGPLQSGMVDDFIDRKHGRADVAYPHPSLEEVLKPTYGVILYQEQVMQIAQVLSGYSLGGADLLRRAMGKKKAEIMEQQRAAFVEGAVENGVEEQTAADIFDLVEKFAGYGFNKSHSAAYALVAYQTAWLKTHHPVAFMCADLSSDMDNTDGRVVPNIEECQRMKMTVLKPDVNTSDFSFTAVDEQTVGYGLGAVKGVGEGAIESLLMARESDGAFSSLADLCRRVDGRRLNRRALEALLFAGALDSLGPNRATLLAQLPDAIAGAEQQARAATAGQNDMFGHAEPEPEEVAQKALKDWPEGQKLRAERDVLGWYFSGHPMTSRRPELKQLGYSTLAQVKETGGTRRKTTVVGMVAKQRRFGGRMEVILEDGTARLACTIFERAPDSVREAAAMEAVIVVSGRISWDDYSDDHRLTVDDIQPLEQVRSERARELRVTVSNGAEGIEQLLSELTPLRDPNGVGIDVRYQNQEVSGRLQLNGGWKVRVTNQALEALHAKLGDSAVEVIYGP